VSRTLMSVFASNFQFYGEVSEWVSVVYRQMGNCQLYHGTNKLHSMSL
jgi:hypothetical protein